ncbi:MAG: Sec-independent protein translocase protein TatA [Candidatus Woesebacteria bacterium GW2011_GWB1_43_14]|uniref:Sec-independent protein translocase protein TatA n=1 Tax=Candidatus Woesebacteria bacterium GW2011_GWB1_43_14 TaxID=1618578 RepID=A0A0G1DLS6_9BACT|nr:MAG: Sec-independent protein translocase protein TatA [Candidatus Woesebacteria bacterium GW2011_GWB1_43_14]
MFRSIGSTELIVIALVVVLLFGGKKIPEFFKGLGEAVKEFKKATKDSDKEDE